jgi:uncharacterized protein YifN (PemK superfamily)
MDVKVRPFLLVKSECEELPCDFTALPISKVSNKHNLDSYYDIEINNIDYPTLSLNESISYIRTHKIQTVHSNDINKKICDDIRDEYPDLVLSIKQRLNDFVSGIF